MNISGTAPLFKQKRIDPVRLRSQTRCNQSPRQSVLDPIENKRSLIPMRSTFFAAALLASTPAFAQTGSVTLYELPFFAGRSVTVTSATPDLTSQSFAKRAQSAKVSGSWQACPEANYAGSCQTLAGDQRALALVGLGGAITSLRNTEDAAKPTTTTGTTSGTATGTTATSGTGKVDLTKLAVSGATIGQNTVFFVKPMIGGLELSAGNNDKTVADAFCKKAGYGVSLHATRMGVQRTNLIEVAASTKGNRGYPLRDVLCSR
jgi:hypothetical protein